jgi:FkbM family methyltransferase
MGLLKLPSRRPRHTPGHLFDLRNLQRRPRDENQERIRSLCNNAYLGNGDSLCRVLGRFKMFVDTTDVGVSTHMLLDGYWEMWLTETLSEVMQPGQVAVDIGANLGYFTLLMAELVGPTGSVHAFEPNPPIANRLIRSCDINGFRDRVTVYRDPLGAVDGLATHLIVPEHEPKNAHIGEGEPIFGSVQLTTRRFDDYPALADAAVIKIDAEGAELNIWRGMSARLDRRDAPLIIFLEFASCRYDDPGAFLDEIQGHGFSLAEVTLLEGVVPRTREEVLAAPADIDQMLMLRR